MSSNTSFAHLRSDYAERWAAMTIPPSRRGAVEAAARRILNERSRYEAVEAATGVPWWWIGAIHNRESGCDFRGVLHNGERIIGSGRKTRLVPRGRGPFSSWEHAARDALSIKSLKSGAQVWTVERCLYEAERFNGFGYRQYRCIASPYLWSFSNHYSQGKYVADGKWSATAVDKQIGVAPLIKVLMDMVPDARFAGTDARVASGQLSKSEVRAIQKRLRDLGYFEVGKVDGVWGPKTVGALVIFQAAQRPHLTLPPSVERAWVDEVTRAALTTAAPREPVPERASRTAQELRAEGDKIAKATWWSKVAALVMGTPAVAAGILEQVPEASEKAGSLQGLSLPGWAVLVAALGGAVALYLLAQRTETLKVAAVREGRDAGPP